MKKTGLLKRLDAGETVFGFFSPYPDTCLAQMAASAGADFIIFDAEHGYVTANDMPALSLAAEHRQCTALVRVPAVELRVVGSFLDNGAHGIVAPMVSSVDDVLALNSAVKFPPEGNRGLAPSKSANFGLGIPLPDYIKKANENVINIGQIETKEAVDNLDAILADDSLDIVFVGPADLSTSLGHCMDFENPTVISSMMEIADKVNKSDKHLGILAQTPEQIKLTHMMGARFIAGYLDTLIGTGCQNYLCEARVMIAQE